MATTFQLKRSSVVGKQPNVADLLVGELAVNLADGILYSKNTAGNIIVVGSSTTSNILEGTNLYFTNTRAVSALTGGSGISIASNGRITSTVTGGGGGGGGANVTVSSSPPGTPGVGDVWIDSDTAIYYTYIDDGDSDQWVEIAASTIYTNDSGGGGGSVDLTSVSSNIVPDADVTYDIGSPSLRFRDIYLSGNTINLGNALIQADAASGAVIIVPTPTAENPNPKATLVSPSGSITSVETSNGTVNTASISNISNTTSDAFFLNSNTITSNVIIPTGKNAMSAGPITIAANIEVTISLGSEWTVV